MHIKQIFKNNKNWIKNKLKLDSEYFKNLSKGQNPEILYIGCSDSRVTAEDLMGVQPGEVFVHRNIANMVPNTDVSAMSVINYAVSHLKVNHVVVCGHYYCGGVKAIECYKKAIEYDENIDGVYREISNMYEQFGHYSKALIFF